MGREINYGPVSNPDGSPTELTKQMLEGTGRDPVEFAANAHDPLTGQKDLITAVLGYFLGDYEDDYLNGPGTFTGPWSEYQKTTEEEHEAFVKQYQDAMRLYFALTGTDYNETSRGGEPREP